MDNRTPVDESSGEMEDSPKDNDDCEDAFQDKPEDSGRNPTTLENQVIPSIREDSSENQLPSGISAETSSRPFVPTCASSSQALNIDQLDETLSSTDVFYSSRKFRIRTKCSRSVDAVISNRQHLTAFQDKSEESGKNPITLGIQVLPSFGQDPSVNKQLPSAISAETSSRPSVNTSASSSQALSIDQLDETVSSRDVFYSSRDLRIHTNCSRRVDALLSPRQNPTDSSMPVLEYSDVGSAKINRRDRSPLGEGVNTDSVSPPQPPPVRVTRSLSKARNRQKTPTHSPEKRSVETGIAPTSTKRRRTLTPERDSSKSGTKNESFRSKISPSAAARTLDKSPINVQTREKRAAARVSETLESLASPLTSSNKKRKIMESSCGDAMTANDAFKPSLSFPTSAANIDHKSPTNLQTQESKVAVRNLGESATEGKTSITSRDCSTDSNPLSKHSNPDDLHQTRSFINLSTEEHEATTHSNISTDVSSASPNKDSRKRRKISSALVSWTVEPLDSPEKESVSLKLRRIPTNKDSSSNLEQTSNPQNSPTEDCEPCMEVKTQEFSSVLSEETQSASNIAHSAIEIQILESSRSRHIIENPDLPSSPSKVLDSGIETQGFKTSPSSRIFSNPHLPEQSSSSDINVPHRLLELGPDDEKEGTDRNLSDSSTRTSEPNVKPRSESKKSSTSGSREILRTFVSDETLTSRNLSEIQDHPEVPMQENSSDPLLQRQHSGSISSGASTSRELSEVEMDLEPPYIDVHEGQPSTSSHQPVIRDGSSAGDRFNSSSGVPLSGETRGRAIKSNTSAKGLSKYASNAQMLLLTVLEEIMKFNEEKHVYLKFSKLFLRISKFSSFENEMSLKWELMLYLIQRRTARDVENVFTSREITLEYHTQKAYEALIRIVVTALVSTVSVRSSLNFDTIMINYRNLISLYEKCSQFWRRANVEDIQDEDSRNRVAFLKEMSQRLLLQTRNAFRELLMHIGEHADQGIIDMYEKELLEEDKSFLRRQF